MPKTSIKGYKRNSPDKDEPELLIPSNKISMKNVPHKVLGIDNFGYSQIMEPNFDYEFPGDYVIEKPIKRKLQKGGDKNKKPSERKPIITNDPKDPRLKASQTDSLILYNNSVALQNYYNKYTKENETPYRDTKDAARLALKETMKQYKPQTSRSRLGNNLSVARDEKFKMSDYYQKLDDNRFAQREEATGMLDLRAPFPIYDKRIKPQKTVTYSNDIKNDRMRGDMIDLPMYDPIAVKPYNMLTSAEKIIRDKKYPQKTTQTSTKKPVVSKKPQPKLPNQPEKDGQIEMMQQDVAEDDYSGYDITPTENKKVIPKPTQDKTDFYIQSLDKDGKQKVKYFNSKKEKDDYDNKLSKDFYQTRKTDNSTVYTAILPEMENGGELPLPPIGSKAYYDALKAKENKKSDNTTISKKPRKLSEVELKEYDKFREKQEKNRFAKNSNYTREELTTREKRTPESDEHRRKQNQKYANSHGGYVNENGDYVQGLGNDAADTKIANRTYDNIVEPLINAEMVISGVGALGKGALKVAAEAEAKQLLKQVGKTPNQNILSKISKKVKYHVDDIYDAIDIVTHPVQTVKNFKAVNKAKKAFTSQYASEEALKRLDNYGMGELAHKVNPTIDLVSGKIIGNNQGIYYHSPMTIGQGPSFVNMNPRKVDNAFSTGIHELTHQLTNGNNMISNNLRKDLESAFTHAKDDVTKFKNTNTKKELEEWNNEIEHVNYYTEPTEVHARINELRHHLNPENPWSPIELQDKMKLENDLISGKLPSNTSNMLKLVNGITNQQKINNLTNLMNKVPGLLPAAVAGAASQQEYKYGGTMNKLGVENSLWNNIQTNKGSGKKPSKEMLEQERKISKKQMGGEPEFDANNPLKYSYETLIQPGLNTPTSFRDMNMGNSYNPQDKPAPLPKPDFRVKPLQLQDQKKKEQQEQFGLSHIPILATNILAKTFSNSMNNREIERNNQRVNAFQSSPTYTPQGAAQYGDYTHDLSAYRPMAQLGGQYSEGFGMETVAPQINMPNQSYAHQPVQEQYIEENTVSNVPAKEFIKQLEGFEKKAKWDYAQNSVGYGTKAKYKGEVIDEAEAENRLEQEVVEVDNVISKKLKVPIRPNEKTTLLSLGYNLGPHSPIVAKVIQKLNNNEDRNEIAKYIEKSGLTGVGSKKILKGLVNRRKKEANMLLGNFQEGGEYEMSEDEIEEFILQGGQLKYLD